MVGKLPKGGFDLRGWKRDAEDAARAPKAPAKKPRKTRKKKAKPDAAT